MTTLDLLVHEMLHGTYLVQKMLDEAGDPDVYRRVYAKHPDIAAAYEAAQEAVATLYVKLGSIPEEE